MPQIRGWKQDEPAASKKYGKTYGWRIGGRIEVDVFRGRNAEEITAPVWLIR